MKIAGLQKVTLLDYPGLVACTVFTPTCNFRCPWCHNPGLVNRIEKDSFLRLDDFFDYLQKRKGILDGVCVTGGEPTLQEGLEEFLKQIKELGYKVKLDTNGYNPKRVEKIIADGLVDYVAMDVKNSLEAYSETVGIASERFDSSKILQTISLLKEDKVEYEFRTTLIKPLHDEKRIREMVPLLKGARKYFLQDFKDTGELVGNTKFEAFTPAECVKFQKIFLDNGIPAELRGIDL